MTIKRKEKKKTEISNYIWQKKQEAKMYVLYAYFQSN